MLINRVLGQIESGRKKQYLKSDCYCWNKLVHMIPEALSTKQEKYKKNQTNKKTSHITVKTKIF